MPTQYGEASFAALADFFFIATETTEIYTHVLGGGFGRRGAQDYVRQATAIGKQFPGVPIKMIWSREEDMTHDFFRPISQASCAAGIDAVGTVDQRVQQFRTREARQGRPPAAGLLRKGG